MESDILMPQLRFPQFTEKWSDEFMGNLYPQIRNGFVGTATPYYRETGVKYLQGKNIKSGEIIPKNLVYICGEFHQKSEKSQLRINDILMVQSGHVGECAVVCKEYENANCHALVVCTPVNKIDSRFYVYLFYSRYGLKKIYKIKTGNTIQHILASELKKVVVPKVEFEEQQKIADFLSSVDKKISLLKQKYRLLQQYKKGVMQQLFSQQIRFKDDNGKAFPDWQEKTLADLSDKISNKNKDDAIKNVLTNSAKHGIVNQRDYFDKDIANENNLTNYSIVDKDDFVYNPRISQSAPVGPIKRNHIGQGIMSPLYTVFRFKETAYLDFMELFFQTTYWYRYMGTIANIGARHDRMNITMGDFFKLPIDLPGEEEIHRIVVFVTSLNKKVELAAKQIELTQTFKKGLLQQMFV